MSAQTEQMQDKIYIRLHSRINSFAPVIRL
jgi:hypothetical protein